VGGNTPTQIDVRFLSATSRDLDKGVETGEFRKDLYYRLAVIPLRLPPLRERKDDLLLFVDHFVRKFNRRYNKDVLELAPSAVQMLMEAPWKGNIRELENVIERAVLLTDDKVIMLDSLCTTANTPPQVLAAESPAQAVELKSAVEQAEITAIRRALEVAEGNRSKAAKILGIGRRTLYDKIDAYDL